MTWVLHEGQLVSCQILHTTDAPIGMHRTSPCLSSASMYYKCLPYACPSMMHFWLQYKGFIFTASMHCAPGQQCYVDRAVSLAVYSPPPSPHRPCSTPLQGISSAEVRHSAGAILAAGSAIGELFAWKLHGSCVLTPAFSGTLVRNWLLPGIPQIQVSKICAKFVGVLLPNVSVLRC